MFRSPPNQVGPNQLALSLSTSTSELLGLRRFPVVDPFQVERGLGMMRVTPERLKEIPSCRLHSPELPQSGATIGKGIGVVPAEADRAIEVLLGGTEIVLPQQERTVVVVQSGDSGSELESLVERARCSRNISSVGESRREVVKVVGKVPLALDPRGAAWWIGPTPFKGSLAEQPPLQRDVIVPVRTVPRGEQHVVAQHDSFEGIAERLGQGKDNSHERGTRAAALGECSRHAVVGWNPIRRRLDHWTTLQEPCEQALFSGLGRVPRAAGERLQVRRGVSPGLFAQTRICGVRIQLEEVFKKGMLNAGRASRLPCFRRALAECYGESDRKSQARTDSDQPHTMLNHRPMNRRTA